MSNKRWEIKVDDKLDVVLLYIHRGWSIRRIAKEIHKSIGTVQAVLEYAETHDYCENNSQPGKRGGRTLTQKGRDYVTNRTSIYLVNTTIEDITGASVEPDHYNSRTYATGQLVPGSNTEDGPEADNNDQRDSGRQEDAKAYLKGINWPAHIFPDPAHTTYPIGDYRPDKGTQKR